MQINTNRLGEMLLEAGLIDRYQLESALSMQRNLGGQVGSALVKLGYLPEETITEFLASQEKYSRTSLHDIKVPAPLMALLSTERMLELTVFPVELRKTGNEKILRMAMTDPIDLKLIGDLQFATGCRIIPLCAAADEIIQAIEKNIPEPSPELQEPVDEVADAANIDYGSVDFSVEPATDPRLDLLMDLLMEKGVLSVLDIERIKYN